MKKLLILDNYDSFTYNLVQLVDEHGEWDYDLKKNDEIEIEEAKPYTKILLSPGPGLPHEAGILNPLIEYFKHNKSILGVCLGQHAIATVFGGQLYNLAHPVHGVQQEVEILKKDAIFSQIPNKINVGLYHSWAVSLKDLPQELEILAISINGVLMALRHKNYDIKGVQFHPESIMTPQGRQMIWNWLDDMNPE